MSAKNIATAREFYTLIESNKEDFHPQLFSERVNLGKTFRVTLRNIAGEVVKTADVPATEFAAFNGALAARGIDVILDVTKPKDSRAEEIRRERKRRRTEMEKEKEKESVAEDFKQMEDAAERKRQQQAVF